MTRIQSTLISGKTGAVPPLVTDPVKKEKIIFFPEGLVGFSNYKRYILLNHSDDQQAFYWLKNIDAGDMAFPVTSPLIFLDDYKIQLPYSELTSIQLTHEKQAEIMVIVTVPSGEGKEIWLNLQAPLIINKVKKMGKQVVLPSEQYPLRYKVVF